MRLNLNRYGLVARLLIMTGALCASLVITALVLEFVSIPQSVTDAVSHYPLRIIPLLVSAGGIGLILSAYVSEIRAWASQRRRKAAQARLARTLDKVEMLAQDHPELALVLLVLRDELETQQAESSRSAFWTGLLQNFVFYALGVVTPLVLVRLHIG